MAAAALGAAHRARGADDPTGAPAVRAVVAGFGRQHAARPRGRTAPSRAALAQEHRPAHDAGAAAPADRPRRRVGRGARPRGRRDRHRRLQIPLSWPGSLASRRIPDAGAWPPNSSAAAPRSVGYAGTDSRALHPPRAIALTIPVTGSASSARFDEGRARDLASGSGKAPISSLGVEPRFPARPPPRSNRLLKLSGILVGGGHVNTDGEAVSIVLLDQGVEAQCAVAYT